jgi:hypothetical protein
MEWQIMSEPNRVLDAGDLAHEQGTRIVAATCIGLNAAKPLVHYQSSLLRLWAGNVEVAARNYENGFETFRTLMQQQFRAGQ